MAFALRPPPDRDPLVRMVIFHWALGALTGVGCAALLLLLDVAGLRGLLISAELAAPALALLFGGFAITFGGVIAASAVMLSTRDDDDDDRRGGHGYRLGDATPALQPALVPIRRDRRVR